MKNNITLKIAGQEVQLTDSVQFAITKTFKNLSNPTDIINDWSKTITIPFSDSNNRLFGSIYNPNRRVIESDNENAVGVYFDPSKKVDFQLLWGKALLISGYMKMTSIEKDKGYSINLFGSIGKVFSELSKLTTVASDDTDEKYVVNPLQSEGFYLTAENVIKSWHTPRIKSVPDPLISKIGFAPANAGYNDSFESGTVQLTTQDSREFIEFKKVLEPVYENYIYDADTIVGNGLLPRQFGEYRSYYQQPYIFVDSMFEELQRKTAELTDYSLILDEDWFNYNNPYYYRQVMLLKVPAHEAQNSGTYVSTAFAAESYYDRWTYNNYTTLITKDVELSNIDGLISNNRIINIKRNETMTAKFKLTCRITYKGGNLQNVIRINKNAALFVTAYIVSANDESKFTGSEQFIIVSSDTELDPKYYPNQVSTDLWTIVLGSSSRLVNFDIYGEIPLKYYKFGDQAKMVVNFTWIPAENNRIFNVDVPEGCYLQPSILDSVFNLEVSENDNRSFDFVTFNDIWDNDYNYFTQCLNYTKMYNLIWDVNDVNKTITIKSLPKYFSEENKVLDWTDKVDYKSNYKLEPLIYDSKYYKLGYEESEIGLADTYLKRYGNTYGDQIIQTKYNFNSETKSLLEGLKTPIINTSNVFGWGNMYHANVIYTQCLEPMINLVDSDNNSVDGFGTFLFYDQLKTFTDIDGRQVRVSDDTPEMQNSHKYTYSEDGIEARSYPKLTNIYTVGNKKYCAYFGLPKLNFDATANLNSVVTIYEAFWSKYISEYTNLQNHKLMVNVHLSPTEFLMFKHNQLVKIDKQLYLVNKISDYSFNELTKCELIRVDDVNNYKTWNFN